MIYISRIKVKATEYLFIVTTFVIEETYIPN